MEAKSNLYYKDSEGNLVTVSYGKLEDNLNAVNDQGSTCEDAIILGLATPVTPILCAIEGGIRE